MQTIVKAAKVIGTVVGAIALVALTGETDWPESNTATTQKTARAGAQTLVTQ